MLGPGNYRLKFLVRDNSSGHIGTFEQNVSLYPQRPNQLQLSSVMLSSQLVADTARVRGQGSRQGGQGQQIRRNTMGSTARVQNFSARCERPADCSQRDARFHFPANSLRFISGLCAAENGSQRPCVQDSFSSAMASAPMTPPGFSLGINPITHAASFRLSLPLEKLATGNYTVQAVVVETGGTQAAFARNYFNLRKARGAARQIQPPRRRHRAECRIQTFANFCGCV